MFLRLSPVFHLFFLTVSEATVMQPLRRAGPGVNFPGFETRLDSPESRRPNLGGSMPLCAVMWRIKGCIWAAKTQNKGHGVGVWLAMCWKKTWCKLYCFVKLRKSQLMTICMMMNDVFKCCLSGRNQTHGYDLNFCWIWWTGNSKHALPM